MTKTEVEKAEEIMASFPSTTPETWIATFRDNGTPTDFAVFARQEKVSRGSGTVFESPGWSPDGKRIMFTSNRDGGDDVYAMRANGSKQERLTVNGLPRDASPVFSPTGRKITLESNREGNFEIYKLRTDGSGAKNLTNDPAADFAPDWQPLRRSY
ncbi:MAG: PD40 domain-containing protein [Rubrobacter sp.]|nr:PD40 domain-containing protein [Rubrobacter sp.]